MPLLGNVATFERKQDAASVSARRGIIDIGSNSVRLVVYDGPRRSPFILFNEKVMAGLGGELDESGRISDVAMERGVQALRRFSQLVREMEVSQLRCVATAAVRDAVNGLDFVERAEREARLKVEVLSGRQEGEAAAYGVLSAIPGADGIVGDLGGGSLELARIRDGRIEQVVSLPLGVLRLADIRKQGKAALQRALDRLLGKAGWEIEEGLPFYMVGGSWRALARLDMQLRHDILPVVHQHEMTPARAAYMLRVTSSLSKASLKQVLTISPSRAGTMTDAAALLATVVRRLGSSRLVVSAYGLREGLLYQDLAESERALDPLLIAAEAEGEAQGRFPGHGALIDQWISPLFDDDTAEQKRIRKAACLLGDVGWRANPEFRAERGVEIALHSNWVGIDIAGRALLAQALYSTFGGGGVLAPGLVSLAEASLLERAAQWGLAIRLAQRLTGGVAAPLESGRIRLADNRVELALPEVFTCLYGESVQRRLRQLGQAMHMDYGFVTGG